MIPSPGRRRSRHGSTRRRNTPGRRPSSERARSVRRPTSGRAWTRSSSVTRRSSTSPTSSWRVARCAAVRQAVHRVEKAGYRCRVRRHGEIPPTELADVSAHTETWRDTADERGFSMALGRLGDPADGTCVLVEAIDAEGQLRAVLSLVPWGPHGLSLDLMRRDRDSDNGLMEFMVVGLIEQCRRLGVERISLNFAMFREVFDEGGRIGAGPVIRLTRSILLFFSKWWQLESLYRSNAKYQPEWVPRLVCFRSSRDLPRISVAMGIAEGFRRRALAGCAAAPGPAAQAARGRRGRRPGFRSRPSPRPRQRRRRRTSTPSCPSSCGSVGRSSTGCARTASTRTRSASPVPRPPPRCGPRTRICRPTPAPARWWRSPAGWC